MAVGYDQKERIALMVTTGFTILGILIGFVAGFTDYWMILTIPGGSYRNASQTWLTGHHSGLWRICLNDVRNDTSPAIHSKHSDLLSEGK